MSGNCDTCETKEFCTDIRRCLHAMLHNKYGETGPDELEELTADDSDLDFHIVNSKDVFKKPLSDEVRNIIKNVLN